MANFSSNKQIALLFGEKAKKLNLGVPAVRATFTSPNSRKSTRTGHLGVSQSTGLPVF